MQGLFHKIQALLLQSQGSFQGEENHFQRVFKDLAVLQGVFEARANHVNDYLYLYIRTRSFLNRRNLKTPAFRFHVDEKKF